MPDPIDLITANPDINVPDAIEAELDLFVTQSKASIPQLNAAFTAMNFNSTNSTSSTSLTEGTGSKSFTIEASKSWLPGMPFTLARTSDGSGVWMRGVCDTYNSGSGAFTGTVAESAGTAGPFTDWTISFGVPPTLSPGSKVLIATVTASADTSADIEDAFSLYSKYLIEADDVTFSGGSGNIYARMKLSGAYVTTSTYDYVWHDNATAVTNQPQISMGVGINSGSNAIAEISLSVKNPSSATQPKLIEFKVLSSTGSSLITNDSKIGFGMEAASSALEGIRIYPSTGTISGNFKLYGVTG